MHTHAIIVEKRKEKMIHQADAFSNMQPGMHCASSAARGHALYRMCMC